MGNHQNMYMSIICLIFLYRRRGLNGILKLDNLHFGKAGVVELRIVFHMFMVMNISLQDILLRQQNFGILFISLRLNHGCGHLFLFLL